MADSLSLSRHESRRIAFTLLFAWEFHKEENTTDFYFSNKEDAQHPYNDYIHNTFFGVAEHLNEIDGEIEKYAEKWKVSRMSRVTRSLLRLSVYELLYTDTPARVAINEIVEFAKEYDDDASPAFINGILNKLARASGKMDSVQDMGKTAADTDTVVPEV